ncbi:TIGR01777 family oxidoreductase [Pseudonocardia yuanmonensis]|uniref:TIGR01777 family oxidoreductase n=1 Tax=Pseudonocardia yuanmonensis TaxID=1095914 RepID=A0ABP8W750_9PSEU
MRVVVAGSSGLIGTALVAGLREAGHEVVRLVRRAPSAPDERGWDPPSGAIDEGALDGADAVVSLGGVGIGDRPWSGARKQAIRDSRNVPTEVLATAVARAGVPAMISGSAVGYYGDAGPEEIDESAPSGEGFLAEVCRDWEAATAPAADAGVRVVRLRTGLVLSPSGGLLALMRPVWKAFLGARIGSGEQYMPWVSLDDEVAAIRFAVENDSLSGPVNVTGPTPVTNKVLTQTLASAVGRPAPLVVPAFAVSAVLGDMGREMLLFSQRAMPRALLGAGFSFRHTTLADALSAAVRA